MAQKKMGLGKGLGALLSIYDEEVDDLESDNKKPVAQEKKEQETTIVEGTKVKGGVEEIPVSEIRPNPNQPRKNFDPEALNELANSIKTHGIIQPIVVNKDETGYMIIAGDRR